MPSNILFLDTAFPTVAENDNTQEGIRKILNYLRQQNEHLKYALQNIDTENLSADLKQEISGSIDVGDGLMLTAKKLKDDIAEIESTLSVQAGEIAAKTTTSQVQSLISSGINGITLETTTSVSNGQTSATFRLYNGSAVLSTKTIDYTTKTQVSSLISTNSAGITLSVTNGEASSTIQISGGGITTQSKTISFSGLVKFSDLSGLGTTSINGSNITTGTISADRIQAGSISVDKLSFSPVTADGLSNGTTYIDGGCIQSGTIVGVELLTRQHGYSGSYIGMTASSLEFYYGNGYGGYDIAGGIYAGQSTDGLNLMYDATRNYFNGNVYVTGTFQAPNMILPENAARSSGNQTMAFNIAGTVLYVYTYDQIGDQYYYQGSVTLQ